MPASSHSAQQSSLKPWFIWGLACFFYFYENLLQMSPSVIGTELMRDFGVTSQTLGILSGIYFYSYAGMQLPGGLLMDYFGPQRLLTLATAVCAICTIAFGLTTSFFTACIARLLIGFGSAFAVVGTLKIASTWFAPSRFAVLTGLMVTIGMMGAIFGEAPLALLIDAFGWRHSMLILGLSGLVLALFIYLFAKDAPESRMGQHRKEDEAPLLQSLVTLMKNSQLWLVATYGGLMYLSTPVFCGLWGVPFLMNKMLISKTTAANYVSLVLIGWAIGGPLWGAFSNYIGRRKTPLYIGSIVTLFVSLLFIYGSISQNIMSMLLFLFGFFSAAFLPAFSIALELCNRRYAATGLSFMNMMNMIGIALIQPLIGVVLDQLWQGEIIDKVRQYPISAYETALGILPLCIFLSLLILFKIKETHCQSIHSENYQHD